MIIDAGGLWHVWPDGLKVNGKPFSVIGNRRLYTVNCLLFTLVLFTSCGNPTPAAEPTLIPVTYPGVTPTLSEQFSIAGLPATLPPVTGTAVVPTTTPQATPTLKTADIACADRMPDDDLLITITKQFPIGQWYVPDDLVSLTTILPPGTVWGELNLRQVAAVPLAVMIQEMKTAGLNPQILSAYRSYSEQAGAFAKWQAEQPWRADVISARPGSSEHQLGTTVDFGSPELAAWVDPQIQFHAAFANTREGIWLTEHAHEYGFTLSYPEDGFETTGFVYEPWHYRYVGVEVATWLHDNGRFLTEWQLANVAFPCLP